MFSRIIFYGSWLFFLMCLRSDLLQETSTHLFFGFCIEIHDSYIYGKIWTSIIKIFLCHTNRHAYIHTEIFYLYIIKEIKTPDPWPYVTSRPFLLDFPSKFSSSLAFFLFCNLSQHFTYFYNLPFPIQNLINYTLPTTDPLLSFLFLFKITITFFKHHGYRVFLFLIFPFF